ncbi:intermembrane lipid transfer protein VPS13B-like isoform X2 [Convolutriloba macropyga]|uniref:intermembrane lipid transfer protein VPS13B-like isoform X2 n=1 Tax=Convolutriloba macropyga TaxID=536237 RepID=UPI003F52488F
MLESYVAPLLMSYVSKYIKNIQPRDLNLSIWNGDVTLHKLDLRLDVIEQELKMPFKLLSGHINQLDLRIPWMTLGSEPVVVNISTIELVFTLKPAPMQENAPNSEQITIPQPSSDSRPPEPKNYPVTADQSLSASYTQSFITKIVNNVSVNINNLILKYIEDDIVFSLNLTSLQLFTADANWEKAFVDAGQSPNFAVRKVCNISDLTMCLDKRNNNGIIEAYQDPILYRCSFCIRTHITFDSAACSRMKTIKVHVFFDTFDLSLSDVQLPMFLRLISLIVEIYYGTLELPNRSVYIESDLSPTDREALNQSSAVTISSESDIEHNQEALVFDENAEQQEGWISWAWNRMPAVWSDPEAAVSNANTPRLLSIGIFANRCSMSFRPCYSTASRKLPVEPALKIEAFGCGIDVQMYGLLFFSCDAAATQITSSVLGFCPCGARDCSYENLFTFLTIGETFGSKVGPNFITNSLFDEQAPENMEIEPSPILDSETYFKVMTEQKMKDIFGAFHFSYVFQLSANESEYGEIVYNPSERLLPYPEASYMKLTIYPCNLMITSSVVHRMQLLTQHASKVTTNYQPYSTPKEIVPTKVNQHLPNNTEWSLLNQYISKRQKSIKIISPNVVISISNHQHLDNCLPLLYEDQSAHHLQPLLSLQLNCDVLQITLTTPMYAKRVVGLLSLVPNLDKNLFDQCFSTVTATISKGTLSLCKLGNDPGLSASQKTFTSPVDLTFTSSSLCLQNFWKESDIDCSSFYHFQTSPVELFLNKAQFLFLIEFALTSNCLINPKINAHLKLGQSSLVADIFDDSYPKLHLVSSFADFQSFSKSDYIVVQANVGHLTCGYFQSTDAGYMQIFKTESQTMPHSFVEIKASLPGSFESLNVDNNSFDVSVSSFSFNFAPLLKTWLCYDVKFSSNANQAQYYSPIFFLFKGEQVFSNYCSASVILATYEKPAANNQLDLLNKIKCLNFQVATEYSQVQCYHPSSELSMSVITVSLPIIKLTSQGYNSVTSGGSTDTSTARTSGFPWFLNLPFLEVKTDSETVVLIKTTSLNLAVTNSSKSHHHHNANTPEQMTTNVMSVSCHFNCENVQILLSNPRLIRTLHCLNFINDVIGNVCVRMTVPSEVNHDTVGSMVKESMASPSIIWRNNTASDVDSEEAGNNDSASQNNPNVGGQPLEMESESHKSEHAINSAQNVKTNLFLQATLNKLDILLYKTDVEISGHSLAVNSRNEKPSVVATVNEISLIADTHSASLQTKLKLTSVEIIDCGQKIFSSDPWFRYDTFCHSVSNEDPENDDDLRNASRAEEFLRRFRQNHNQPRDAFCSVIFTKALSRVILQKLASQTSKKLSSAQQMNEENYVSEICVNMSSFDGVVLARTVSLLLEVFNFASVHFEAPQSGTSSQTSRKSLRNTKVLCVRNLPLVNVNFQESRFCIPVLEQECQVSSENERASADCFLVQMESLQVTPHTDRPIQRSILKNSFYTKALLSGDINVPGALVEDRQYSLTVKNFCIGTVKWEDLLLSPDKQKLEILDVRSQNPALEWNKSEYLQAIMRPLKMAQVLDNISIRSEFAPAIVVTRSVASKYTEFVVVSGHAAQMELSNINVKLSDELVRLAEKLVSEFSLEPRTAEIISIETETKALSIDTAPSAANAMTSEFDTSFGSETSFQQYSFSPVKRRLGTITETRAKNAFVLPDLQITRRNTSKKAIPIEGLLILSGFELNLSQKTKLSNLEPLAKMTVAHSFISYKSSENDLLEVSSYGFNVLVSKKQFVEGKPKLSDSDLFDSLVSCSGSSRDVSPLMRSTISGLFANSFDTSFTCKVPISFHFNPKIAQQVQNIYNFATGLVQVPGLTSGAQNLQVKDTSSECNPIDDPVQVKCAVLLDGFRVKIDGELNHAFVLDVQKIDSSGFFESKSSVFGNLKLKSVYASTEHPLTRKPRSLIEPFDINLTLASIFENQLALNYVEFSTDLIKLDVNKQMIESLQCVAVVCQQVLSHKSETRSSEQSQKPEKSDSNSVAIEIFSSDEGLNVEDSKDDIRNGSLTYISEKTHFSEFPGVNQVSFSDESDSETYMSWCYESPRSLKNVEISPMPFRNLFETKIKPKVVVQLSAWDVANQTFVFCAEKVLSEDELVNIVDSGSIPNIVSPMWRLEILNNELSSYPKQNKNIASLNAFKLVSAISLGGSARVDSEIPVNSKQNVNVKLNTAFHGCLTAIKSGLEQTCSSENDPNHLSFADVVQFQVGNLDLVSDLDRENNVSCNILAKYLAMDLACDGFLQNIISCPNISINVSMELNSKKLSLESEIAETNVEMSLPKIRAISGLNFADFCSEASMYTYIAVNKLTCNVVIQHPSLGHFSVRPGGIMPIPLPIESSPINVALNGNQNFAQVQLVRGHTKNVCLLDHRDSRFYSVSLQCCEPKNNEKIIQVEIANSFSVTNYLNHDVKVVADLLSPKNKVLVKSVTCEVAQPCDNYALLKKSSEKLSIMLPLPTADEIVLMHISGTDNVSASIPVLKPDPVKKIKMGSIYAVCKIEKSFAVVLHPQYNLSNFLPFELTILCSNLSVGSDSVAISLRACSEKQLIELDNNGVYEATLLSNTGVPLFSQPPFTFSSAEVLRSVLASEKLKSDIKRLQIIVKSVERFVETSDLSVNIVTEKSELFEHSATFHVFPKLVVVNQSEQSVSIKRETHFGTNSIKLHQNMGVLVHKDCSQFAVNLISEIDDFPKVVVELLQDEVPRVLAGNANLGLKLHDVQEFSFVSTSQKVVCFLKISSEILADTRVVAIHEQVKIVNESPFDLKMNVALCKSKSENFSTEKEGTELIPLSKNETSADSSLNPWKFNSETSRQLKVLTLLSSDNSLLSRTVLNNPFETIISTGNSVLSLSLTKRLLDSELIRVENCGQPAIVIRNISEYSLIIGSCKDAKSLPEEILDINCNFLTEIEPKQIKAVRSCKFVRFCCKESKVADVKSWSDHIEVAIDTISIMIPGIGCIYGQFELKGMHTELTLSSKPFDLMSPRSPKVANDFNFNINLSLKEISLSYFDCAIPQEFPSEVLRLTIAGPRLKVESLRPFCDGFEVDFSIRSFQIDNQLAQSTTQFDFPVIFLLQPPKNLMKSEDVEPRGFFCGMRVYKNDSELKLQNVKMKIEEIECLFEDTFFTTMLHYGMQIKQLLSSNADTSAEIPTCTKSAPFLIPIESIEVEPISVKLSLHANIKMYIALDQSPLYFYAFKKDFQSSVSFKRFSEDLVLHYGSGLFLKAGVALGSLDIIGNPMRFVSELKTGVKDLLTMPYDGLTRGPTSFITGITGGGISCVKHISSGALGCLVNLSFSIAKNLDRLSMDVGYSNYQNQLRRHKPVYFSSGVVKGMTGFGIALLGAVAGVVNLPIETMTKAGEENYTGTQIVGSMVKGVSAGLVGVLAKPIGGAADFVAHTGQGLMTTTGLVVEHSPKVRPKLQLNLMSCPALDLFNMMVLYSNSFSDDVDHFLVTLAVNATLSIASTRRQLTTSLALSNYGLYIWLRHSIQILNMEPSFAFYPFHLIGIFEDKDEESKIYLQLDLSDQIGDNHQLSIDSDCNSSVDLLSRYVRDYSASAKLIATTVNLSTSHDSVPNDNDDEESEQITEERLTENQASGSGIQNPNITRQTKSQNSSSSTLENDMNSSTATSTNRTLHLYLESSDKKLFLTKYYQLTDRFRREKGLKDKLQIVQVM